MKFRKIPVKGMCDILPEEMRLREYVLSMIKETYELYVCIKRMWKYSSSSTIK